jgi:hypothetical protein
MNWGYRIVIIYLLFVSGIVTMAVLSFRQPLDMENENYYEAEKDQDNRMQQRVMGNAFKCLIKIEQTRSSLLFILPNDIIEKPALKGGLKLTRPSDADLDKTIPFDSLEKNTLYIDKNTLKTGLWKYALEWSHAYGHYLIEDTLVIL